LTILFLSREYPPETGGGGIGSYVAAIAPALAARGHEVHVLSCVAGQPVSDYLDSGVWIHRRNTVRLRLRRLVWRTPATVSRLECAISCYVEANRLGVDVDVVEAPDWMAEGLMLAVAGSTPVVAHLHTPLRTIVETSAGSLPWNFDLRLADRVERLAIRRSASLTSPSRLLVGDLGRDGWLGERTPRIIRYGVDAQLWDALPSPSTTAPLVLAVGRLEARKAPDVLLEAAARLATVKGLDVVFVGREQRRAGSFSRQQLAEQARRLEAPIRFIESVPRNELRAWYAAARVVVVPSRYDNFPFVALEAMAAGRAVVCTARTGTAELADGSDAITVVPSGDADALAAAVRPFLDDPELAARAGARARDLVILSCGLDRITAEREVCYQDAIAAWVPRARSVYWWRLALRLMRERDGARP
jgi:glycogen synthase